MFLREANLEQQQRSYELFLRFFPPSEWTKGSTNNSNNPLNFPAPQKRFIMTCDYPSVGNNNNNKPQDVPSAKDAPLQVTQKYTHT